MPLTNQEIFNRMQKSPIYFIEGMWKLKPERDNTKFIKGKHITWQQEDILLGVEKAVAGEAVPRISVSSGRGIGKSSVLSWLVLWYLFCHKDAQIACTAPTTTTLYDVLWKELSKWINDMPEHIKAKYEWTGTHVRITERPTTWFASAKTARKETPEALSGVHGDHVMLTVDEASGVDDAVFDIAQGSLTGPNTLQIMTSNPTRLIGYFYESHHKAKDRWQTFQFSSLDSPIVDKSFVDDILQNYGEDSDQYRIHVLGEFPRSDAMDGGGYVPLFSEEDVQRQISHDNWPGWRGEKFMGVDPAGEGRDKTVWVVRDQFSAQIVADEAISDEKSIAQKTLTLMDYYGIKAENVTVDNFGVGANVSREIALAKAYGNTRINAVNVGEKAENDEIYLNKRAEIGMKIKQWLRSGGEFIADERWADLLKIRYRRELSGKMKIMGKLEMRRLGMKSPDYYDALALTFYSANKSTRKIKNFIPKWLGFKQELTPSSDALYNDEQW